MKFSMQYNGQYFLEMSFSYEFHHLDKLIIHHYCIWAFQTTKWLSYGGQFLAGEVKGFLSSLSRPDQLWGSPSLLSNGYWGPFTRGKATRAQSLPLTSI